MKKVVCILIASIILLYIAINDKDQNTIVIYSALEQYRNEDLNERLAEQFPDLNIQIMYMPTAKIGAKIQNEKEKTDADIVLAVETGYMEKIVDSLAPVREYTELDYIEGLNPEHGKYLIWESYGAGIVVNTDILKKYGLEEPKTYEDLLKPEYKNRIVIPDPGSSSTGYNFYLNMYNEWGFEKTLEYYDRLNENIKQYAESGSGPIKMLIQGECAVGFGLTYQVVAEKNNGNPLKMIYTEQGSPYSADGLGLIKGREQNEDILKVFKYIANEYLLYDKEYFNPGEILKNQKSNIENYPENIKYANMNGINDLELKDRLLDAWKY